MYATTTPLPASLSNARVATSMIARQAIVTADKAVVGYELFNRSRSADAHTVSSDVILLVTALSHSGREDLISGTKLLFVNTIHESLAGEHLDLLDPEKVVLEVEPLGHVAATEAVARVPILAGLRERGFKLSFNHTVLESAYASWLTLANFIKLDLTVLRPEQLAVLVGYAGRVTQAQLIAAKVESADQFEMLKGLGISLFQGYWFSRPSVVEAKLLAPNQTSIIQLINLLRGQASLDDIEEVLKKDAALAFNLMRLINSVGYGSLREITSFRQAVMIMGLKKMFRWAVLLLTASKYGNASSAVGQAAVIRGRLMELLALEWLPEEEADQAFVVGIFSLLPSMLHMPMQEAVQLVSVPDSVRQALLYRSGHLGELLHLAEACENHDDARYEQAAAKLELTAQQINWAHLQALAWCDHITE